MRNGWRDALVKLEDYVWVVPYVQAESEIFFKAFFPSRKGNAGLFER